MSTTFAPANAHVISRLALALLLAGCITVPAFAGTVNWTGLGSTPGSWADAGNWDPGLPLGGDTAFIELEGAAVTFDHPAWVGDHFYLGATGAGASFTQIANTLTVNGFTAGDGAGSGAGFHLGGGSFTSLGNTIFGRDGNASATQTGGTLNADSLILAESGGNGSYTLQAGAIHSGTVYVGGFEGTGGTPLFRQEGGTHSVTGALLVGRDSTRTATYELAGGSLDTAGSVIGWQDGSGGGIGVFAHTAGTHSVSGELVLGESAATTSGTYTLSGSGVLEVAGSEFVGKIGLGTFNQIAGTHTVQGNLYVDAGVASKGVFNLHDGLLDVKTGTFIGNASGAAGEFNQDGGLHQVAGSLNIGGAAGAAGSYQLQGGSLQTQELRIGDWGDGSFSQSGGINTVNPGGILVMAENVGSSGTYNLSGGTLNAGMVLVGDSAQATFNHSGTATHNVGDLALGIYKNAGEHGRGSYNLQGGSLNSGAVRVGNEGTGSFTQSDGVHSITGSLIIGVVAGSEGLYDLQDGTLDASGLTIVVSQDGKGTLNLGNPALLIADRVQVGAQGTLSGSGKLDAHLVNAGLVSPGNSPGLLALTGDYEQQAGGTLKIEIAGLGSFDQLALDGHAWLDGTLDVYKLAGYTPHVGDTFTILTAGNGLDGSFANVSYTGFGNGVVFDPVIYDAGTASLRVAAVPEPETWAMLLAGLGLVGMAARRRNS